MSRNYVNKLRGDGYYSPNEKFWIKEEPVSPNEEDFDNYDFECNGMRKSLSMNDLAEYHEEPRYRKHIGSNHDLSKTKFVSLAESVYHYERDTPGRFHTTRPQIFRSQNNVARPGLTVPQSPLLRCKARSRPIHIISQEEKENMIIEEMKNFKIKAHPVPKSVIAGTKNLPDVPKKPNTVPEPFKLTETQKKPLQFSNPIKNFKARPAPKHILEKPQIQLKAPINSAATHNIRRSVSTDHLKSDKKNYIYNKEAQMPQKICKKPLINGPVQPEPFSFQKRDEELKKRKEEKIRIQIEEERKMASQFKAQPLPNAVKKQMHSATTKSSMSNTSSENKENYVKFEARQPIVLYKEPFKPLLVPSQIINPAPFDLKTEKRAAEREKFEHFLKEKEAEKVRLQQQKLKEQKEADERAQAELKAKLIHHAKPMPAITPFIPEKSTQPLTVPETPKFVRRLKQK